MKEKVVVDSEQEGACEDVREGFVARVRRAMDRKEWGTYNELFAMMQADADAAKALPSQATFYRYVKHGNSEPTYNFVKAAASVLDVRLEWLGSGTGTMLEMLPEDDSSFLSKCSDAAQERVGDDVWGALGHTGFSQVARALQHYAYREQQAGRSDPQEIGRAFGTAIVSPLEALGFFENAPGGRTLEPWRGFLERRAISYMRQQALDTYSCAIALAINVALEERRRYERRLAAFHAQDDESRRTILDKIERLHDQTIRIVDDWDESMLRRHGSTEDPEPVVPPAKPESARKRPTGD